MSYKARHNLYGHRKARREWLKTPPGKRNYSALIDTLVISTYMERVWDAYRQLPDKGTQDKGQRSGIEHRGL